ncbi:hypothetical protein TTHERM_00540230 (macronuclear) [Tetrahymena thermophila SB210]|uniref:PH domain protein n=1 Tax=Tetrahymena thermophila (strain SB210) TaxID=312017 RepID=I7M721_TETTS|nr:hypothetical protein TTHERM_00540230 [Tetrahymena thermophila SB210]EAR87703.1 hypothetical protein TTHERM_00540230 [Tetrahymena thermophila SB210]|eukprot:XP_001007948.1 hypothetical protein TTHERM_00540230 [Tetrahymena thermophila SB210]
MSSSLINPAITKLYKKSKSNQSTSTLETISEEKSFFLCTKAKKVSKSGLFSNDRFICIDNNRICYYSKLSQKSTMSMKEMQKVTPKLSFKHSELHSVQTNPNKPNMLIINVLGNVEIKGQLQKFKTIQQIKFLFKNQNDQFKYKMIMEKIIDNEKLCLNKQNLEDQYISILHNF